MRRRRTSLSVHCSRTLTTSTVASSRPSSLQVERSLENGVGAAGGLCAGLPIDGCDQRRQVEHRLSGGAASAPDAIGDHDQRETGLQCKLHDLRLGVAVHADGVAGKIDPDQLIFPPQQAGMPRCG